MLKPPQPLNSPPISQGEPRRPLEKAHLCYLMAHGHRMTDRSLNQQLSSIFIFGKYLHQIMM